MTFLTIIPFLVWRQIGSFPSFISCGNKRFISSCTGKFSSFSRMYYAILQSKSFFLSNFMLLPCIVICLLWLGSSHRITAKFCFMKQCLVFSLGAMYSPFKMFIHQYRSWLIPRSFGQQEGEMLEVSCASYRANTALFTLAELPLSSMKAGFETRAKNLVSDTVVQATVSPKAEFCSR